MSDTSAPPFAALIRRLLRERGLGLREFCRAVEVDPSFFSKVLAGKRSPPSEDAVLRRIALELELDPCELIVSAGRIPREWSRLFHEPPLLQAVDRLCQGATPLPAVSSPVPAWSAQPTAPTPYQGGRGKTRRTKEGDSFSREAGEGGGEGKLTPPKSFGEELL
ncbi:MAG: helix-turn-helix transcriptional regulator [Elusimicrobia bacterium]|nr:helix-turn-helix transcriptional regulator [Elusimicrobiota bacterium]